MRLRLGVIGLGCCFLLVMGARVDGLPFFREYIRYSDSVTAHWPNALFLRQTVLEKQDFPLWRETTMAGQPFAANPLNKTAYPLQWLVLLFPPTIHLNVLIAFHLLIAGMGMWKWVSSLGLRTDAVVLSVIAYAFAPRIMGHLGAGHLDVVYAMAWFPWLMWAARTLVRQPVNLNSILQLSLIAALLFLADVRVSLFAFVTASVYAVIEMATHHTWKRLSHFAISGLVFLLMMLSLVVPLLLWTPYMSRAGLTSTDVGILSIEPIQFLSLILAARPTGVETLTYLGFPILTLAMIGVAALNGKQRWLAFGIIAIIVLYSMGSNSFVWSTLVELIPGLRWFRVPSRVWLILALLVPLFAGYGFQSLFNYVDDVRSHRRVVLQGRVRLLIVAGMVVVVISGLFAVLVLPVPKSVGLMAVIGGLGVGSVLLVALSGRFTARVLGGVILVLAVIDLGVFAYSWVEWRALDYWLEPQRALAERLVEIQPARIYSPTYSLEQQTAEAYGLNIFGGVDPFQLKGIVSAVGQGSGVPDYGYSVIQPPITGAAGDDLTGANRDAIINTGVLAEWDVSHVIAAYPISNPRLELVDVVNDVYIYNNLDYVFAPDSSVPDWPSGWADLPDPSTVERLNQITLMVWAISMTGFLVSSVVLIYLRLRVKRG